jgi:L-ascorbate metabolism protein UlaG (beta-lactamase superfamily)
MFCSNEQFSISCRSSFQVNALFSLSSVLLKKLNDFSERCGIASYIGPKRYRPPALIINDLPDDLDAVFISHNHYDHLDYPSVKELNKRYGERLTWFCGLGTRQWFLDNHIKNVVELDWWEEYHFSV